MLISVGPCSASLRNQHILLQKCACSTLSPTLRMANALISFETFDFGCSQDVVDHPPQANQSSKQTKFFGTEDLGDLDYLCSQYGLYQGSTPQKEILFSQDQQYQNFSDFVLLDDFQFNQIPDLVEDNTKTPNPSPISSGTLELLNKYTKGMRRMNWEEKDICSITTCTPAEDNRSLSTEEVMRVAGARYIQFSDNLSMLRHPFGCALPSLTNDESKDVELAHLLLASAEKVSNQQFDRASKLIAECIYSSSITGNPVQRIVYRFAEALQERINQETGRIPLKGLREQGREVMDDVEAIMMTPTPAFLACHQALPFSQIYQFSGIQVLLENLASATKVHLIDLGIRSGMPWTILMQAFAARHSCPIEHLKITAIGTIFKQKGIEETGKRLIDFAETLNLPFSFGLVIVSDMKDLKEDLFEIEDDEAIAVYSPLILRTMLHQSDRIETVMRVIRNLNPCIMVVVEVEANHNSSCFVTRFIEVLFFYSAYFDSLEACMDQNHQHREIIEGIYLGQGIKNAIAMEGEERKARNVGIDIWRAFFARFGMVETELGQPSLYQAKLIANQFSCRNYCTLDMNGKCLTIGWKGTPLHSLSAWKFH